MSLPSGLAAIKARLKNQTNPSDALTEPPKAPSVSFVSDDLGGFEKTSDRHSPKSIDVHKPLAIPDDEREAIMLCSGMPSTWARVFSALEADRPPQGLSAQHWQDRLDAILIFADRYARELDGLGWDAEALFAIGEHWQRLDLRGHGWFIAEDLAAGGVAVEISARSIIYKTIRGAVRTIFNEAMA